jgi:micrococcal nuclease
MTHYIKISFSLFISLILSSVPVFGAVEYGNVLRVIDGDSLILTIGFDNERIRLYGIDAPEILQEFGIEATDVARELVAVRSVAFERMGSDRYRRSLAIVRLPNGRSLNAEMVRQGYAWWSRRHAPDDLELAEAEREARAHRRGLWRQPEPIPPWVWRAEKRKSPEPANYRFRDSSESVR